MMSEILVTTTLEISYSAILTDSYSDLDDDLMTDRDIKESVEKHIEEWCTINNIDRDAVTITDQDIERE
jgi:hypothetical protein